MFRHIRRHAIAAVASCLALGIAAPSLLALCIGASLEQYIDWADLIFVGTVQDATPMRLPQTIMTRYRFQRIRYVKGTGSPDTLSLVQEGGEVGTMGIGVEDEPSFEIGKRYVILAKHGTDPRYPFPHYKAMSCVDHYAVDDPEPSRSSIVLRRGPQIRLAAFDDRHMVWVMDRLWRYGEPLPPYSRPRTDGTAGMQRRSLPELFHLADSLADAQVAAAGGAVPDSILQRNRIREIWLYSDQDPGTRVTEEQFANVMRGIIDRLSRLRSGEIPRISP